jgi:hypothetical protein
MSWNLDHYWNASDGTYDHWKFSFKTAKPVQSVLSYVPPVMCEWYSFFASLPRFGDIIIFILRHSDIDAQMTRRNFQVFRVLGSTLRMEA